jgi:single-stranded-DNA-specific exonuclease
VSAAEDVPSRRLPVLEPRWAPPPPPSAEAVSLLARELQLPAALCALLVARGVSDVDSAKRLLRPLLAHLHDPDLLPDASRAARRLLAAIDRAETILVHGDYDVDGISAAALLTIWLRRLGARVVPFVPHRLKDGYDFGRAGVERALAAGAKVVVTADCGMLAHTWVEDAAARGIDVIVTDHHAAGASLPPAFAVVNPNRADSTYPERSLCGTGVAFKLCQLLATMRGVPLDDLLPHLDLVALATVADLVPLEGENRVLVRYGLRALGQTTKPGLKALLEVTGLAEGTVEAGKVGFVLAPRINAAGRLGDAADGLELLLEEDAERAKSLAVALDELNRERQREDKRTLEEALDLLEVTYDPEQHHGVVLAKEGWHPGVIGIVASRVVERIHRPVVMIALDGAKGRGSARSIPGFHLHEALGTCAAHMERWGGHKQAAGMDVRADALPAFRTAFEQEARRRLAGTDLLRPRVNVDLELAPGDATLSLLDRLRYLGPHGIGNPRPVFLAQGLQLAAPAKLVGKGNHLRLALRHGTHRLDGIGFHLGDRVDPTTLGQGPIDAVFQLQADEYQGRVRLQARFLDVQPARDRSALPNA